MLLSWRAWRLEMEPEIERCGSMKLKGVEQNHVTMRGHQVAWMKLLLIVLPGTMRSLYFTNQAESFTELTKS